jgi:DNA-binding transcriptional MocR family regulator
MATKPYKKGKRGAGRHVQLPEYLQASESWASLKPGPRALYLELKRRFNGRNNGQIILSHRDAATAINVSRNTIGGYFDELVTRGLIAMTRAPCLGPAGIGQASLWALQELPISDGKPAQKSFLKWRKKEKPRPKTVHDRHNDCDTDTGWDNNTVATVTKFGT